jgi:nucleotide-binding universal stress UspA family protein
VIAITAGFATHKENPIEGKHMKNKVLVAIDESGLCQLTTDSLSAQTRPDETEVLVLQIVEPLVFSTPPEMAPGYAPEAAIRQKESIDRAARTLAEATQTLRKAGFTVNSRVVESEVKEGILNAAGEWGADLIVVTSHFRKGVAKFLHRSVAQGIVQRAPCSVLVVKEAAREAAA